MRIIAVANQKGGCGKTTIIINLAACLAREGQRTLAVDLDPQGHCGLGLAVPEEQIETSIADALMAGEDEPLPDMGRITWQISSNFDLVPSKGDLAMLEQKLAGVPNRELRLRRLLESVRDKYDFVLIDSPPTVGFLTQSALHAADEVIVPVDTGYFSLHGLSKQLDTIRLIRSTNGRQMSLRILANLYDVRTKLGREILAELRKRHGDAMFSSFINFNTKLKESTSLGQPITEYDPASSGCKDFVKFARELASIGSVLPTIARMPTAIIAQEPQIEPGLLQRAEALAADADRLLATSQTLIGSNRPSLASRAAPNPQETQRKIEAIYGPRAVEDGVLFVLKAETAQTVRLAGDFNDWNPGRTPMIPLRDGSFQVKLPLGPGKYRYRYVIDGRWESDPANQLCERNPYGELDSVVMV
jgi:chromosome partitioning protein